LMRCRRRCGSAEGIEVMGMDHRHLLRRNHSSNAVPRETECEKRPEGGISFGLLVLLALVRALVRLQ
jgi:hypothetical protein